MGGIKRDCHQSVAFGEFDEVEGNSTLHALPCRWRAGTQRGLLPSGVITSLAGRPSPRTRNRHMIHTQQRRPSPWNRKSLQKDHVSPSHSWWSPNSSHCAVRLLSPHTETLVSWVHLVHNCLSKCVGLLPNPSPAFPQSSASRRANWVPWCSQFNHTPVSSVPQSPQPCAPFSAPQHSSSGQCSLFNEVCTLTSAPSLPN